MSENRINIVIPHTGNLTNDLNTANVNAKTEIDRRMTTLCTAMKAKGIIIYTITFGVSDAPTSVPPNCLSDASKPCCKVWPKA